MRIFSIHVNRYLRAHVRMYIWAESAEVEPAATWCSRARNEPMGWEQNGGLLASMSYRMLPRNRRSIFNHAITQGRFRCGDACFNIVFMGMMLNLKGWYAGSVKCTCGWRCEVHIGWFCKVQTQY